MDWKQELAKKDKPKWNLRRALVPSVWRPTTSFVLWSHIPSNDLGQYLPIVPWTEDEGYTDNIFTNLFRQVNQFFSGKHCQLLAMKMEDRPLAFLVTIGSPLKAVLWSITQVWGEIGNLTTQLFRDENEVIRGLYPRRPCDLWIHKFVDRSIFYSYLLQDKYKYQLESHNPYVFSSHDYGEAQTLSLMKLPIFCQGQLWINQVGVAQINGRYIAERIVGDKLRSA